MKRIILSVVLFSFVVIGSSKGMSVVEDAQAEELTQISNEECAKKFVTFLNSDIGKNVLTLFLNREKCIKYLFMDNRRDKIVYNSASLLWPEKLRNFVLARRNFNESTNELLAGEFLVLLDRGFLFTDVEININSISDMIDSISRNFLILPAFVKLSGSNPIECELVSNLRTMFYIVSYLVARTIEV